MDNVYGCNGCEFLTKDKRCSYNNELQDCLLIGDCGAYEENDTETQLIEIIKRKADNASEEELQEALKIINKKLSHNLEKKDIKCNNCGGIMKYHKNKDILIPVGSESNTEKKICKNCKHFVEFNGKMVCEVPTLKYNDCPDLVNSETKCYREDDFEEILENSPLTKEKTQ